MVNSTTTPTRSTFNTPGRDRADWGQGDTREPDDDNDDEVLEYGKFNQSELNDLVRDLDLPKAKAELLASRLAEKNCLAANVRVSFYRNRDMEFRSFFAQDEDLVYCHDVEGLVEKFGHRYGEQY